MHRAPQRSSRSACPVAGRPPGWLGTALRAIALLRAHLHVSRPPRLGRPGERAEESPASCSARPAPRLRRRGRPDIESAACPRTRVEAGSESRASSCTARRYPCRSRGAAGYRPSVPRIRGATSDDEALTTRCRRQWRRLRLRRASASEGVQAAWGCRSRLPPSEHAKQPLAQLVACLADFEARSHDRPPSTARGLGALFHPRGLGAVVAAAARLALRVHGAPHFSPAAAAGAADAQLSSLILSWLSGKYFRCSHSATFTRPIRTGTSTSGPMTAANAAP